MDLNDQILEAIQQVAGIFLTKNIPTAPVNLDYLEERVAPGMETIAIKELIMHLEDLLSEYIKTERKVHIFTRYVESFKSALEDNCDGGHLIGRSRRTA